MNYVNVAAEGRLVGAVLSQPEIWPSVDHLSVESFVQPVYRILWSHLQSRNGRTTPELVQQVLTQTPDPNGKPLALTVNTSDLYTGGVNHDTALELASIVAECHGLRELERVVRRAEEFLKPGSESVQERVDTLIRELSAIQVGSSIDTSELFRGIQSLAEKIKRHQLSPGKIHGLRIGWGDLDGRVLGGLEPGNFLVIASGPGEGKSIFLGEAMRNLTTVPQEDGKVVRAAFFGLEMSGQEIAERMAFARAGIDANLFRQGKLEPKQWNALHEAIDWVRKEVSPNLFYFGPGKVRRLSDIVYHSRYLVRQEGVRVIGIDYLQRVQTRSRDKRTEEIGDITSTLKALAAELNVTIIAISQITREASKNNSGRPSLHELADSASIERDADYVLGLWRPTRHLEGAKARKFWDGIAILDLLKGRFRERSECYLRFDGGSSRFIELTPEKKKLLASDEAQSALRKRND